MITPNNLAPFTDTYVWIDQSFLIQELFTWTRTKSRTATAKNEAFDGTLRLYTQYFKDEFDLFFPKLSEEQADQLEQLLSLTGTGVLHTVQAVNPQITRLYDAVTTPGYGINTDVNRIRKKVWFQTWEITHWPNQTNFSSAKLHGLEA